MESIKKVFVALANKKFIEHSKSLFHSAKIDGKWDGDFVLIVPSEDKGKFSEKEFTDKGIEIFFGKPLPGNPNPHYYKYYLWTEYFKKWDWIFYCDMDVLFFNKIEFDLSSKQKNVLYANEDNGRPLNKQFEYRPTELEKFDTEQKKKYDWLEENYKNHPSFQSCFMLFHSSMITKYRFKNLIKLHNEYYVYYNMINKGLCEEQSILNMEFIGSIFTSKVKCKNGWEKIGDKFVNAYQRANDLDWDTEGMKSPYYDETDYTKDGIVAVHFYQFFQPWSKHNLRFNPIWKKYNEQF